MQIEKCKIRNSEFFILDFDIFNFHFFSALTQEKISKEEMYVR